MPTPTPTQRVFAQGYEPNSIAARFTDEQRRAFKAWLKERDEDCRAITKAYRNPAAAKK